MYETPQKNLSLTLQMTEISDIYPSNFGQWYHPRGSITIFVLYQFELGMTQRLIWHMTQVSATKSFVGTTQIKCGFCHQLLKLVDVKITLTCLNESNFQKFISQPDYSLTNNGEDFCLRQQSFQMQILPKELQAAKQEELERLYY